MFILGAGLLVYMISRQNPRLVLVHDRPFQSSAEVPCPDTVLSMCPGGIPRCYVDGTVSCDGGGFRRDLSDVMARMQAFCVENPAVCKPPKVNP